MLIYLQVVEYLTYQLIDGYKNGDKNVTSFFDDYEFWIIPFHNPDGMAFAIFSVLLRVLLTCP